MTAKECQELLKYIERVNDLKLSLQWILMVVETLQWRFAQR